MPGPAMAWLTLVLLSLISPPPPHENVQDAVHDWLQTASWLSVSVLVSLLCGIVASVTAPSVPSPAACPSP